MSSDTFVTNVNISVKSLNLSLPQNLSCVITTNTDVNTTKLDNIMNVIWFQYNGTRNTVPLLSNNYRVYLTTNVGRVMFESKLEFKEARASMVGLYQCRAWIGKDFSRNKRDHTNVTVKRKNKTNIFFYMFKVYTLTYKYTFKCSILFHSSYKSNIFHYY